MAGGGELQREPLAARQCRGWGWGFSARTGATASERPYGAALLASPIRLTPVARLAPFSHLKAAADLAEFRVHGFNQFAGEVFGHLGGAGAD